VFKKIIPNIIYVCFLITLIIFAIEDLSKYFAYFKIFFYKPSVSIYFFIYLFSLIPIPFLPKTLKLPSDFILLFIYVLTYIPAVVVPFFLVEKNLLNNEYILFLFVFVLCFVFLLQRKPDKKRNIILTLIKPLNIYWFNFALIIIYIISTTVFIINFGFKFEVPSLLDVYDVRLEYREVVSDSLFSAYMVGWMAYIINIFTFLKGIQTKNVFLIIFTIVFQFYLFSLMALKSHLAVMILSFLIHIYLNREIQFKSSTFIKLTFIAFLSFFLIDLFTSTTLTQALITRRVLIVPAQLTYYHFDFFNENIKTFWGYNIFSIFSNYNYHLSPPKLIGDIYFNKPEMTAVVNMFMEGYTAFGYLGVFLVTFILKFFLNILDNLFLYKSKRNNIMLVSSIILAYSLSSSSILTVILTHGLLILIILFTFYPSKKFK
jgi:hypothetical protein